MNGPVTANHSGGINAYGYTEVHFLAHEEEKEEEKAYDDSSLSSEFDEIAASLPKGIAVLFVSLFGGERLPRLVETWKVDSAQLNEALAQPLASNNRGGRNRDAERLAVVLKGGERLSGEWSPVIAVEGNAYIVERECVGRWGSGGYYVCNRVIKLTFKQIEANNNSVPYCQLSLPRKKTPQNGKTP